MQAAEILIITFICICISVCYPDKGGDGGDSGGSAGSAGSEWSPAEVQGELPRKVSGAGPTQEGRGSSEGAGEGEAVLPVALVSTGC